MSSPAGAAVTRAGDESRRRDVDAAVVCVPLLMRDLVRFMPSYDTEAERRAYISAVKDIAVQVNAAIMTHDPETGELTLGGCPVDVLPALVDEWL